MLVSSPGTSCNCLAARYAKYANTNINWILSKKKY